MKRQRKAHKAGVAPNVYSHEPIPFLVHPSWVKKNLGTIHVGSKFNPRNGNSIKMWGYKTQVAQLLTSYLTNKQEEQLCHLEDTLTSLDMSACDLHSDNIGLINKKLVCIDFGDISTS
jgi:hypothetical protein